MKWLVGITLVVSSLCTLVQTERMVCQPTDTCSCSMKDGRSISLWPIDDPDEPRFQEISIAGSPLKYDYSPCTSYTEDEYYCKDVLMCGKQNIYPKYQVIAKPNTFFTLLVNHTDGRQYIAFQYQGGTSAALILLNCDQTADIPKITSLNNTMKEKNKRIHKFMLTSRHTCIKDGVRPPIDENVENRSTILTLTTIVIFLIILQLASFIIMTIIWCKYFRRSNSTPLFLPNKMSDMKE